MFGNRLADLTCPVKVGVEIHKPYLDRANLETFVAINEDARTAARKFASKSFDAVILVDFIECLEMREAIAIIHECQRIARKRVVLFVPFGNHPQDSDYFNLGGDHWQTHRSSWEVDHLVDVGFDIALWRQFHNKPNTHDAAMFCVWEPVRCSIVIATYNKADLLELSLRSIRQQNVSFSYEIIVVDDGSQDHTREVCRKFNVKYAYLDRPYYCNPAKARNIGLKMAASDIVIQQCEVIHHSPDCLEKLVTRLQPGNFDFAAVWNAALDSTGIGSPAVSPLVHLIPEICYCGPENPRPFFFLGVAYRSDVFAIGGNDEEFIYPGYDDNWLAECLIRGRGLQPRFWDDVVGYHLHHRRPDWVDGVQNEMGRLYNTKLAKGIFMASGGPWADS